MAATNWKRTKCFSMGFLCAILITVSIIDKVAIHKPTILRNSLSYMTNVSALLQLATFIEETASLVGIGCDNNTEFTGAESLGKPLYNKRWPVNTNDTTSEFSSTSNKLLFAFSEDTIHFALTSCGSPSDQIRALVKSLALFSAGENVMVHAFINDSSLVPKMREVLDEAMTEAGRYANDSITYAIYPVSVPVDNAYKWLSLYKPCSAQRLFLPNVLPYVAKVIYLDHDTLILRPVKELWRQFDTFSGHHLAGLVEERQPADKRNFNSYAQTFFPASAGFNSGVLFLHLQRMRTLPWACLLSRILYIYDSLIKFGDQDILNIFFHFHRNAVHLMRCEFNYRTDNCFHGQNCASAQREGVAILHGNRGVFHSDNEPVFRRVFDFVSRLNVSDYDHQNKTTLVAGLHNAVTPAGSSSTSPCEQSDIYSLGLSALNNARKQALSESYV